jgi:hypothetical protein
LVVKNRFFINRTTGGQAKQGAEEGRKEGDDTITKNKKIFTTHYVLTIF